ncbi:hypothetical protein Q1695_015397 [Nippostrongylus brasiliensis]|nr:hypothetical protein Q1695_015397 [Nippostrongylus brasiliensis]
MSEFVRLSGEIFKVSTDFQTGCDQGVVVCSINCFAQGTETQYGLESTRIVSPVSNSAEVSKRRLIHTAYYRHNDQQHILKYRSPSAIRWRELS